MERRPLRTWSDGLRARRSTYELLCPRQQRRTDGDLHDVGNDEGHDAQVERGAREEVSDDELVAALDDVVAKGLPITEPATAGLLLELNGY